MTFIQKMNKRKEAVRQKQKELKACIDEVFDEKLHELVDEEYEYVSKCKHLNETTTKDEEGNGTTTCPDCGRWSCWGPVKEVKPVIYPYKKEIKKMISKLNIL
jgi:hypothetical protein